MVRFFVEDGFIKKVFYILKKNGRNSHDWNFYHLFFKVRVIDYSVSTASLFLPLTFFMPYPTAAPRSRMDPPSTGMLCGWSGLNGGGSSQYPIVANPRVRVRVRIRFFIT
jgi:hypothetical protein